MENPQIVRLVRIDADQRVFRTAPPIGAHVCLNRRPAQPPYYVRVRVRMWQQTGAQLQQRRPTEFASV